MATYTGFIRYSLGVIGGEERTSIEEIDVVASSMAEARTAIERELENDYEPRWTIAHIEQRFGLYA